MSIEGARSRRARLFVPVAVVAALAMLVGASSASAVVAFDSDGNGEVAASCGAVVGVARDFNRATYSFSATASSSATELGVVPLSTGVGCRLIDARTGEVYGSARGDLPGPAAVAVGTATIPFGVRLRVCVDFNAVFSDGSEVRESNCR